jgi:hypothetical protein
MVARYYDQTVDGWQRIAVVESDSEFGFDGFNRDHEVREANLPSGFSAWRICEAFKDGDNAGCVLSRDGS